MEYGTFLHVIDQSVVSKVNLVNFKQFDYLRLIRDYSWVYISLAKLTITYITSVSSMPNRHSSMAYRSSLMEAECRAQFIRQNKSESGAHVSPTINR